ncbi:hypothetical protein AKJ37_06010 [candidate division MSBL1 archaeon SCGC-AAA259I09]|uniref:Calcineurin-like phosphoesterase domain-containing protein n=1 Tax=candidate division MSBL1 archaeon SCGC-AAA259I09 TaxID=1698267 RepID=A0A133UPM0_9EURY|nr:hypothetical protein AKJ37_06010 [candidate division MSBL1 archaeon SCGC-AAA259I09]
MCKKIQDLVKDSKIIDLGERPKSVFVGDTHGDVEATRIIWDRFKEEVSDGETYLVFLGDYVDRGGHSQKISIFSCLKKKKIQKDWFYF